MPAAEEGCLLGTAQGTAQMAAVTNHSTHYIAQSEAETQQQQQQTPPSPAASVGTSRSSRAPTAHRPVPRLSPSLSTSSHGGVLCMAPKPRSREEMAMCSARCQPAPRGFYQDTCTLDLFTDLPRDWRGRSPEE